MRARMTSPLVSVVMPSFNQAEFLKASVSSVLSQDYKHLELIVSDGGSTDSSVALLQQMAAADKRLRWFSEPDNGPADAINRALSKTRGVIIGWLNSDDLYTPGAISRAVSTFQERPNFLMLYGHGRHIDAAGQSLAYYPTRTPPQTLHSFALSCFICQPTVFFRRSMYVLLGPLDETLRTSFDFDYWLRAFSLFQSRIGFVNAMQACSRLHQSCITMQQRRTVALEAVQLLARHLGKASGHWLLGYRDELQTGKAVLPDGLTVDQEMRELLEEASACFEPKDLQQLRKQLGLHVDNSDPSGGNRLIIESGTSIRQTPLSAYFDSLPSGGRAEFFYHQPIPELEVVGISSFYALQLAIWQLRNKDLQLSSSLHNEDGRRNLMAWCVIHGRHEYRALQELTPFWQELSQPADIPETEWSGGISRLLLLVVSTFRDLKVDPQLTTAAAQQVALWWFFYTGWQALGLTREDIPPWQRQFWLDQDDISSTRFAHFVYDQRPDLQQTFDLSCEQGASGFRHWMLVNAAEETILPLLLHEETAVRSLPRFSEMNRDVYPFGVNLIGSAFGEFGLGEDVRMAAMALHAAGVPFTVINLPPGNNIREDDRTIAHWVTTSARFSINIVCLTALEHLHLHMSRGAEFFSDRYTIGYWPWELQRWPDDMRHCFHLVDEVWASSRHIYDAVKAATSRVVEYMPMAVTLPTDLNVKAEKKPLQFNLPDGKYLFVFSFDGNSFIERKNPQAVVYAFQQAFSQSEEGVCLVVKCMRPDLNNPVWQQIQKAAADDRRIIIVDAAFSKLEVMEFYRACDCFVSLHRAEGFGRGIAEALLLGLKVIATDHGGNCDFCEKAGAHLVSCTLKPLASADYVDTAGQFWADPDVNDAASAMRRAFDHRLKQKTKEAQPSAAEQTILESLFSVTAVGDRYRERLESLRRANS